MSAINKAAIIGFVLGAVCAFQNCSRTQFSKSSDDSASAASSQSPSPNPSGGGSDPTQNGTGSGSDPINGGGVSTPSCHDFAGVTTNLKIIFVADNSGSTFYTDPNQQIIQNTLQNFASTYASKTNFKYNFIYFADITQYPVSAGGNPNAPMAVSLINDGNNQDPTFGDVNTFKSALQKYAAITPNGNTPYKAAFNMIAKAIQNDPDFIANPSQQYYAIMFMSDGLPTDFGNPFFNSTIINYEMSNILNLSPGHITMSTAYVDVLNLQQAQQTSAQTGYPLNDFYDSDSMLLLQQMAESGSGQFSNTTVQGVNIDVSTILTLPSSICQ